MAKRIHNLTKWQLLPANEEIHGLSDKPRMVTLEVNCPNETKFHVIFEGQDMVEDPEYQDDKEAGRRSPLVDRLDKRTEADQEYFLGRALGRETFEFYVPGVYAVTADSDCYVYSIDGQDTATRVLDPLVFTRIANRKARNRDLEMIQYQMRLNQERFLQTLLGEQERRMSDMERRYARDRYPPEAARRPVGQEGAGEAAAGAEQSASPPGSVGSDSPPPEKGGGGKKKAPAGAGE